MAIPSIPLPEDLKNRLRNAIVETVARQAEKMPGGDKTARTIRQLSSQAMFYNAFDQAIVNALTSFQAKYTAQDKDLVEAILADGNFWQSKDVRQALMTMINRPGAWVINERQTVIQHFADILPKRVNRERVDKAVAFFLGCILEELWTAPGVREIREIYSLQFQKIEAESARQQVTLLEAQLQATTQLSADIRQALLQLATTLEQHLLAAQPPQLALSPIHSYNNLPHPNYIHFVGRQKEWDILHQRLSPNDPVWQIVITGIGGMGKTALALAIAHDYCERCEELPLKERFEAIIWISAKEEILTVEGREKPLLPGLILRTLEDMYTTISQTLEREDITRALLEEQDQLVQKALSTQRTLLIVDNLESVIDERVRTFLYNLPLSTKCIITSREWVDEAIAVKLKGLSLEDTEKMILEEASVREVDLDVLQRQQLFERTGGLPLPIKLSIGRRASGETFEQVMRWLGNYSTGDLPDYCVKGQIDMARRRDLNAWKLLLACSLFDLDAGVSREALGYIADLTLTDRNDGLTLLQRFSLLNSAKDDRFSMLPIVQGYAEAEIVKSDFGEKLTESWLGWLLEFTQHYGIDLEFHTESVLTVGSEYPHMLKAIRWCRKHERWEILLKLVEGAWFYFYLVGMFSEFREMLEAAVQASKALQDEQSEGRFLCRLGLLFWVQGQYEKALVEYLEKAEEMARKHKDDYRLGQIDSVRLDILAHQGHLMEAEQLAETILEKGERLEEKGERLEGLELQNLAASRLAECESKKQQFDKALEWLNRSERWCRELNWERGLAWNMYRRGAILIQQGNSAIAETFLTKSLSLATSWSDRRLMVYNKYCLAQVYAETGQIGLARQMAEEARDLCERLGMITELAEAEELLGKLPRRNGN